ncbi:MAG: YbaB/EbfC family nucleoid-associated protein [Acetobacteraceae bacterium]
MKNLAGLMKQASEMQERMQELQTRLGTMECEGNAGAGLVRVVLNGKGELRRVSIDPKLATAEDREMLEDLLVAAHAEAKRQIEAATAEEMQKLTGGLTLPPGLKLPF